MEESASGKIQLINDIGRDAAVEAAQIREEAEKQAEERKRQNVRQLDELKVETEKTVVAQVEALRKSHQAAQAVDLKRITLRSRDQVFRLILDGVEEKLAARASSGEYRNVLVGLVVEAAIGLGADEVEVNASPDELRQLDDGLLHEAEAKVKALVLRTVRIGKSSAAPLLLQGIIMNSVDGRIAYNNQIRTRLLRHQSAIRKLIYERLQLT